MTKIIDADGHIVETRLPWREYGEGSCEQGPGMKHE
jgi:hypothetical protein